jgi:hypothetical protein
MSKLGSKYKVENKALKKDNKVLKKEIKDADKAIKENNNIKYSSVGELIADLP